MNIKLYRQIQKKNIQKIYTLKSPMLPGSQQILKWYIGVQVFTVISILFNLLL